MQYADTGHRTRISDHVYDIGVYFDNALTYYTLHIIFGFLIFKVISVNIHILYHLATYIIFHLTFFNFNINMDDSKYFCHKYVSTESQLKINIIFSIYCN